MGISRKPEFDTDLSVIENISQQREKQNDRAYHRYTVRRFFKLLRTLGLIALAYWGWITRYTIQEFIVDFFTNPKLMP